MRRMRERGVDPQDATAALTVRPMACCVVDNPTPHTENRAMADPPSELRRWAQLAYERELKNALLQLFGKFDQWRRGQLDPFELNEEVRRHSETGARDLKARYTTTPPATAVAMAVVTGVLREDELDAQCLALIAPQVKYLRDKARR